MAANLNLSLSSHTLNTQLYDLSVELEAALLSADFSASDYDPPQYEAPPMDSSTEAAWNVSREEDLYRARSNSFLRDVTDLLASTSLQINASINTLGGDARSSTLDTGTNASSTASSLLSQFTGAWTSFSYAALDLSGLWEMLTSVQVSGNPLLLFPSKPQTPLHSSTFLYIPLHPSTSLYTPLHPSTSVCIHLYPSFIHYTPYTLCIPYIPYTGPVPALRLHLSHIGDWKDHRSLLGQGSGAVTMVR